MNLTDNDLKALLHDATDSLRPPVFQADQLMGSRRHRRQAAAGAVSIAAVAVAVAVVGVASNEHESTGNATLDKPPATSGPPSSLTCRPSFNATSAPPSTRAGSRARMVPGVPDHGRLCRYAAPGAASGALVAQAVLTHAEATHLATVLNRIRTVRGIRHCPLDTGALDAVYFAYQHGPNLRVVIGRSGCLSFTNGHRTVGGISPEAHEYLASADSLVGGQR